MQFRVTGNNNVLLFLRRSVPQSDFPTVTDSKIDKRIRLIFNLPIKYQTYFSDNKMTIITNAMLLDKEKCLLIR